MKPFANFLIIILALSARIAVAEPSAAENELAAVAELGRVNGTALACNRADLVAKAKALMIARVPKARRYGAAFEDATDAAFREQTASPACPVDVILSLRLEAADLRLGNVFPPPAPQ